MSNTKVPGQATLPALVEELGYESITNLKPCQERFAWEFVLRAGDATAAYGAAYPEAKKTSANANGSRLLKSPSIQARITEIRAELSRRYRLDASSLIELLSASILFDKRSLLDPDTGVPLEPHKLDSNAARLIDMEIVLDRHGNRKALYKTPKLLDSINELSKILGLHKQDIPGGINQESNVNIYIPDNGRDPALDRLEMLKERFKTILGEDYPEEPQHVSLAMDQM